VGFGQISRLTVENHTLLGLQTERKSTMLLRMSNILLFVSANVTPRVFAQFNDSTDMGQLTRPQTLTHPVSSGYGGYGNSETERSRSLVQKHGTTYHNQSALLIA